MMRQRIPALLFTTLLFTGTAGAVPYEWISRSGEASFRLDVPEAWRVWESVRRNGVIVQFRRSGARIEIRSMAATDGFGVQQILNQKAARLSGEYPIVKYLGDRVPNHNAEMQISSWEIHSRRKILIDQTAVVLAPEGPVVVSCLVPAEQQEKYRTECENAFYSLSLTGVAAESKSAPSETAPEALKLYFVHMPGNLPVVPPEAVLPATAPAGKPKPKVQYDDNYILPDEAHK